MPAFIRTVFLHVLNMLFGLMATRLNKHYYCMTNMNICSVTDDT